MRINWKEYLLNDTCSTLIWHYCFKTSRKSLKMILASNWYQKASGLLQKYQDLTAYHLEHICTGGQFAAFFGGDKVRLSSGIATNNVAIQYYLHPFSGVFRGELQWQRGFACFEAISLHCNCFEQTNCITLLAIHISPKQFRVFPSNTAYGFSPYTLQPGDCGKCSTSVQYFILYITLYYTI